MFDSSCTHIYATPSLYIDLITLSKDLDFEVSTLQVAGYGGAPCTQQLALQMKDTLHIKRLCVSTKMHQTETKIIKYIERTEDQTHNNRKVYQVHRVSKCILCHFTSEYIVSVIIIAVTNLLFTDLINITLQSFL